MNSIHSSVLQSRVSIERLTKFLCNEELDPRNVRELSSLESKSSVVIRDGIFSWGKEEPACLKNVNLDIAEGELIAVVGQVGSGKSSLIGALLGLTDKISGDVALKGTVAYVSQVSTQTVRYKLFGAEIHAFFSKLGFKT